MILLYVLASSFLMLTMLLIGYYRGRADQKPPYYYESIDEDSSGNQIKFRP